jgi:hypothetical protein
MSPKASGRAATCDRNDALSRLRQADSFLTVASLVLDQPEDPGLSLTTVTASMTVLAGIAAADAACCAALGRRARGQSHIDAVALVKTITPGGTEMARDLDRLLSLKDKAHYGMLPMTLANAKSTITWATRLIAAAHKVVN